MAPTIGTLIVLLLGIAGTEATQGVCASCSSGFSGDTCQIDDACVPITCENDGTCSLGVCTCPDGYVGDLCENIDIFQRNVQNDMALVRSTRISAIPRLEMEYTVSFEVRATSFANVWQSVLHFTANDANIAQYGDRNPAIWFWASTDGTSRLHICSGVSGVTNNCYNSRLFSEGEWISVQVSQTLQDDLYIYVIQLQGEAVLTLVNTQPEAFTDVTVYAADPWHAALNGEIRSIYVNPSEGASVAAARTGSEMAMVEELPLVKDTVIGSVDVFPAVYHVQFDVKANSFVNAWQSVIHFTSNNQNINAYGSRNPAVWFHASGSDESRLHICAAVNGNRNYCYNSGPISVGTWVNVQIVQRLSDGNHLYEILLDGAVVHSVVNTEPIEVRHAVVYAADPWHATLDGVIRNLYAPDPRDGQVRLTGGDTTASEGRIEVYHEGQWGTVCDDYFQWDDAHMVCQALGYRQAKSFFGEPASSGLNQVNEHGFGDNADPQPIFWDDVDCSGADTLAECVNRGWGIENCGHHEDAAVGCTHACARINRHGGFAKNNDEEANHFFVADGDEITRIQPFATWNDHASSAVVSPGCTLRLYQHVNYGGEELVFPAGNNNFVRNWNDQLSSYKCNCE